MKEVNRVDFGSIKIHKKVLTEITCSAMSGIKEVSLVPKDFIGTLKDLIGIKSYPGILVSVDKNNQVTIEVEVCIRYGTDILDIARQTQEAIRAAIEKTVEIDLKDVNINIQGIERGKS